MAIYTDIAAELWQKTKGTVPPGVRFETRFVGEVTITRVEILKDGLARRKGRYVTIDMPNFAYIDDRNPRYIDAVAHELRNFLPPEGEILIAGLGNSNVTADSLGPAVCERILVTRHIPVEEDERKFLKLRSVAAFTPGIEGKTGMPTAQTIRAMVDKLKPAAVICVDSLSTGEPKRLGCTVQLTDTGLCPGGDEAKRLDETVLGVPVISMGVPTVMDAGDLCPTAHQLVVTPRDIDFIVMRAAKVVSLAINRSLQKDLSVRELSFLTS